MNIFILEDDPYRIRLFREWLIKHKLTFADSCFQVDRFQPPYDLIFLDHDLGGRQLENHEDNGEAFAKLIQDRINFPTTIFVHSYNPVGVARIARVFDGLHVVINPFGTWISTLFTPNSSTGIH